MIPGQEYSGRYDVEHDNEETLFQWHLERLRLFLEADENLAERVQYVAFETLPRLDEIRAVRRAIRAAGLDVPFWVACVFPGEEATLPDGSSIGQVVQAALAEMDGAAVPWGVGINCTKIYKLDGLVRELGEEVARAIGTGLIGAVPSLVLYPDGTNGEVYNTTTQTWEKPEGYTSDERVCGYPLFKYSYLTTVGSVGIPARAGCHECSRNRSLHFVPGRRLLQGLSQGYSKAGGAAQSRVIDSTRKTFYTLLGITSMHLYSIYKRQALQKSQSTMRRHHVIGLCFSMISPSWRRPDHRSILAARINCYC
jgi:hypothetical protein